jgi:hemerythrin
MAQPGRNNGSSGRASVEARQWQIQTLFAAVGAALRGQDLEQAAAGLEALRRLLAGHFEHEEGLYHPPLRALRPEQGGALRGLAREHERLRGLLARTQSALGQSSLAEAMRTLDELSREVARHEEREDALLEVLEQELAASAPGRAEPID